MAVKQLFPIPPQFVDANGDPYSGALLFFYAAGSSTKQNTYTDSGGGTACDNPITLNSSGYPAVSGTILAPWGTVGETYKIGLAAPGSSDPPASFIWTEDNVSPINDSSVSADQWVSGPAPTYVSATQFTLVGDQTSTFHVGRRVKTTNSGGTVYGYISVSAYTSLTTITVVNDSGTLDAGLSAVSYGLLSSDNPSTPLLTDAYPIVSGSADKTKKLRLEVDGFTTGNTRVATIADYDQTVMTQTHGANVASASTLDLNAVTGDLINVTGTTGITAITLADGGFRTVLFTGALTITNGSSLLLPGGANITTAAGDIAMFRGYTSGIVRCMFFTKLSGAPVLMSPITNSISGDVALNNTSNYFTGPTVAQGTAGTWFVSGSVQLVDTAGGASIVAKLWDGTTVIDSGAYNPQAANENGRVSLSGFITSPAGDLRISAKDSSSTSGKILASQSGNGKDSTITAIRIA